MLIPESSYHPRCVKSPVFDDRKLAHIGNIGPIYDRSNTDDLTRAGDRNFWELALVLIPESSYHPRCVKSPVFDDRKSAHIGNIGPICDRSNTDDLTRADDRNLL